MKLNKDIFYKLQAKASEVFEYDIKTYLEIGVREGSTFSKRVPYVKQKCIAIDCWDLFETDSQNDMNRSREDARMQYQRLVDKYKNDQKVEIIKQFSNDINIINKFENSYFDVIFIDGDHSYEGVKEDLNNWWNKCNTLFCGHDYMIEKTVWNGVECGVKKAVDEFIKEKSSQIELFKVFLESPNPTWYIWKK